MQRITSRTTVRALNEGNDRSLDAPTAGGSVSGPVILRRYANDNIVNAQRPALVRYCQVTEVVTPVSGFEALPEPSHWRCKQDGVAQRFYDEVFQRRYASPK